MLTDPQIVARPARPYVGLRERVPMRELASVIPARIPEMFGWLAAHGLGRARAFQVSEVAGTFAGIAMGLNAFLTAILAPLALHLLF